MSFIIETKAHRSNEWTNFRHLANCSLASVRAIAKEFDTKEEAEKAAFDYGLGTDGSEVRIVEV